MSDTTPDSQPAPKFGKRLFLGIALGFGVYLVMAFVTDVGAVAASLQQFAWVWFVAALGLAFCNYLIRFIKWEYLLHRVGVQVPLGESFTVFLASFLLTVTPGKIGEVIKAWLLKRSRGIPMSKTAPIVVAERLTDLIALLCLALVGVTTYAYGLTALLASGGLIVLGVVYLTSGRAVFATINILERIPRIGTLAPKVRQAYGTMQTMITPRPLIWCTLLSIAGWSLEVIALYLIIGGFPDSSPDLIAAGFVYSLTTILGAVSFLPGGLGVTEGSMTVALSELSLLPQGGPAVAATYLIRLATLWFAVVIGAVAFAVFRRRYLPRNSRTNDDAQ